MESHQWNRWTGTLSSYIYIKTFDNILYLTARLWDKQINDILVSLLIFSTFIERWSINQLSRSHGLEPIWLKIPLDNIEIRKKLNKKDPALWRIVAHIDLHFYSWMTRIWARPPRVRSTLPPRSWSWPTSCWGAPSSSMLEGRDTRWGGTRWTTSPPPDWADWDTASLTEVGFSAQRKRFWVDLDKVQG